MAYAAQLQRHPHLQHTTPHHADMSVALRLGGGAKDPPRTIPGLRPHATDSSQSSPSSDESNSPTELNSYKRLMDKPPLVKRLAMDELRPLVALVAPRPLSGGYVNEAANDTKLIDLEPSRYASHLISPILRTVTQPHS